MELRYYQSECIQAIYNYLQNETGNPVAVVPTGGGKTPIIGTIIDDCVKWGKRVLVLAHVKELLEQAERTAKSVNSSIDVGVYSSGLKRKEMDKPVIVAGIQSCYQKAGELGPFDLIMIDEAHLVPPDGEGRYKTFLTNATIVNPKVRTVGLTATPYRLGSGLIYGEDRYFAAVCYEVGVKELIVGGYLSPLVSKEAIECDASSLHIVRGDFSDSEVEQLMMQRVSEACQEILIYTAKRRSVLIFAAGVKHATEVCNQIACSGSTVDMILGDTDDGDRADCIKRYKSGELKYLVNVGVLTTGFDAPNVDCVALMRATASPGLYYQMVGRGFRLSPNKQDCLILDFGGNVKRHGPVDQIEVKHRSGRRRTQSLESQTKVCPQCKTVVINAYRFCPECDFQFTEEKPRHDGTSSDEAPLSGVIKDEEISVLDTIYSVHTKTKEDGTESRSMRVDYLWGPGKWDQQSEWICVEHPEGSFPHRKALEWWQKRTGEPMPSSAAEAVNMAHQGLLKVTHSITVRKISGQKFKNIVNYELSDYALREVEGFEPPSPWLDDETEAVPSRWDSLFVYEEDLPF